MSQNMYTSGAYLAHNPDWHVEDSAWKAGHIVSMLSKHGVQPKTVAEVGCGAGEILVQLAGKLSSETDFFGFEVSPQAFALTSARAHERIKFYLQDFIEQPDVVYDVVLAIDVFEHVEDYMGFLRKLHRKGVYTVFHIPLDISVQSVLRMSPIMKQRADVGHLHYFTKETALATLRDCGYEIIDYTYTASAVDLSIRSKLSALARLPRKTLFYCAPDLAVRVLGGYSLLVLTR